MLIRDIVEKLIVSALTDLGLESKDIILARPSSLKHGDYTTNVALRIFGDLDKNKHQDIKSPVALATKIKEKIDAQIVGKIHFDIERVEVVSPGFINYFLTKEYFINKMKQVLDTNKIIFTTIFDQRKIIIEFTDPNPFKEFHVGHLYSNIVGESVSRLFTAGGAHVKRANYQGDVGLHVAKAIWGIQHLLNQTHQTIDSIRFKSINEKAHFLGKAYALGAQNYEKSQSVSSEIKELNTVIYHNSDKNIMHIYAVGKKWSLEYFESMYERLGMHFDMYYFESEAANVGKDIIAKHLDDGIFKKDKQTVIFQGEGYGLHTRVFINSLGLPTYEAKELGLAMKKYEKFAYDHSYIITGNEVNEYFKVLLKVLSLINPE